MDGSIQVPAFLSLTHTTKNQNIFSTATLILTIILFYFFKSVFNKSYSYMEVQHEATGVPPNCWHD